MGELRLICPDCGGAIQHQCGAILDATADAILPGTGANAEIAHGLDLDSKAFTEGQKRYNLNYNAQFLVFWKVWPRKRDKLKAQKAWRNAVKRLAQSSGATEEAAMAQILAAAIRERDDPNRLDEFTKYAQGWLNGDGWEDEDPHPPRTNGKVDKADLILRRVEEVERGRHDSGSPYRQAPGSLSAG